MAEGRTSMGSDRGGGRVADEKQEDPRVLYEMLYALWEVGSGLPDLEYDDERDVFCFKEDGRFAVSRERADWELLEERETFGIL